MRAFRLKIKELAKKYNVPESIVKEAYESQFEFMRETIQQMDFENMTEEEFEKAKYIFSFKYLGKFYTNWNIIKKLNKWEK